LLPHDVWKAYEQLEDIFSEDDNWKKYRAALEAAATPAVPFVGRFLQDLIVISEKNPDTIPSTELVNFSKMYLIEDVIGQVQNYQSTPPNFRASFIAKYIESFASENAASLQDLSIKREPKSKYDL
jgi:DNA-directed RNA polymerase specialized sigma24 family protein